MTKHGDKIPNITREQVRERLANERDPKAIKRLIVAREYLDGASPADIEEKYGWHRQTVYNWLNRFEERGFEAALYDKDKPGRPPKLDDDQFDQFAAVLHDPPEEHGYDEALWNGPLARDYLLQTFDVAYSLRHVERLMHKAGVSPKRPRPEPAGADEQEREEFHDTVEKK